MRSALVAAVMLATVVALPATAKADTVYVGQLLQAHSQNSPISGGGPFLIDLSDSVEDFLSFCLEFNVPLGFDEDLTIAKLSTAAQGPGLPDPISTRTAFWYWRFRMGDPTYAGYYVQWMIWCEEGEYDCTAIPTIAQNLRNATTNTLMQSFGWDPNSTNGVGVMTLKDALSFDRQDVLYLNPEPGSLILLGSGMLAVGMRLRRRRE